ncbi:glutamine amidotransferase class-II [Ferroglobus placidus DSM 10642]|uniref:Glutamine amidotransferase class-II n=1 Tax=Ferroglobus placidus (strain DSM 10642 / AEDII12DO) TaxID=589924 RepID=D3RZA0_FERPA|nr:glutamine amidotransferase [Ferroglobus placidus]ADC65813.1 glutamine amidotransferase class-II [Ferroglobus placidus DSM 10642]
MCGIVGVLFKKRRDDLGSIVVEMMKNLQHRGKDGAGVAIYNSRSLDEDEFIIRLEILGDTFERIETTEKVEEILERFAKLKSTETVREGEDYVIKDFNVKGIDFPLLKKLALRLQSMERVSVLSAGKFEIFKDVGYITHVDEAYGISKRGGTHAIGHIRFSTESGVDRYHAHPFQSFLYPDIAVVHNGQITNYWKTRARLEAKGHYFTTDNDTECIVHYVADKLLEGYSLEEALESAVNGLDGPFAFIISTPNEIGVAKDKLGLRPALVAEDSEVFAISSEEVALEPLGLKTEYLAPGEWRVFRR